MWGPRARSTALWGADSQPTAVRPGLRPHTPTREKASETVPVEASSRGPYGQHLSGESRVELGANPERRNPTTSRNCLWQRGSTAEEGQSPLHLPLLGLNFHPDRLRFILVGKELPEQKQLTSLGSPEGQGPQH